MAKHTIDIDRLTEAELRDLNRRIVERLRFLEAMRAHQRMLQFSVGDQVCFEPPGRGVLTGTLVRYNRKTVTVITADGEQWNVAPGLLKSLGPSEPEGRNGQTETARVIPLKKP